MVINLIIILAGILVISFRKQLLVSRAAWEKENFSIKLGPRDIKFGEILAIVIGVISIVFGLLGVFGIVG
jgi:hypothetical protein